MGSHTVTVAETPNGYRFLNESINDRKADSIVDGFFVEPYQNELLFSHMLDWLSSRRNNPDSSCIRYVQSQNGNLLGEFEPLREDVAELEWATECFGTTL
jgi:hypothetical protein